MATVTHRLRRIAVVNLVVGLAVFSQTGWTKDSKTALRVGHFPNLTHAQAVIGRANVWFQTRVSVPIEWQHFNAGPSAIEALLAGALDMSYVGPSPAINVFVRSQGDAIRVVAGAASGGALLVVHNGAGIEKPEDFRGKKVAAPELGNTQDVALRHWLKTYGLTPKAQGGDVDVLSIKNADILALFQRGSLDAAWVPEPWATRLVLEGNGKIFLEETSLWPEGRFPTVILVARTAFLKEHRDVVEEFVRAHVALTEWIQQHPADAAQAVNEGLAKWLGQPLSKPVLDQAFPRVAFVSDPAINAMAISAQWAWELGYLPGAQPPDLAGLFDLSLLTGAETPVKPRTMDRRPPVR